MPGRNEWGVLLPEEVELMKELPWERIFIRSGFYVPKSGKGFSLAAENEMNREYFRKIIDYLGMSSCFDEEKQVFVPEQEFMNEKLWLQAVENLHAGAEGGRADFERIDLWIMDTFMAGIVRWINVSGLNTGYSCDGHGFRYPEIYSYDKEEQFFMQVVMDSFLFFISNGQWRYRDRKMINLDLDEYKNYSRARMREREGERKINRYWLLEVGEKIYTNQDVLREMARNIRRMKYRLK